jgi:hypothetical protein
MDAKLTGSVVGRERLGQADADRLYELFERYYRRVDRPTFDRDLAEKDMVLLVRDTPGVIRGFTTLKIYDLPLFGRRVRAIFNGNTIIEREFWGDLEFGRTQCRFMADVKREAPSVPIYWYLICSGYRTYFYLPLFFREFFPCHNRPTPPLEGALIEALGRMKYPDEYHDGIIRVREPRECLDGDLAVPPPHKLENPHIRFFTERNPGYLRGDELVCITEFSLENNRRSALEALQRPAAVA